MSNATLGQAKHLLELASQHSLTKEDIDDLVQTGALAILFGAARSGALRDVDLDCLHQLLGGDVVIDPGVTIEQMIEAGSYDWIDSLITPESFPVIGNGAVTLRPVLVHFDDGERINSGLLRHADPIELLAYGAKYPKAQIRRLVFAFGQQMQIGGSFYHLYLCSTNKKKRWLSLRTVDAKFHNSCYFLMFEKN